MSEPFSDLVTPATVLAEAMEEVERWVRADETQFAAAALAPVQRWIESGDLHRPTVVGLIEIAVCMAGETASRGRPLSAWLADQMTYPNFDIPAPMRRPVNPDGTLITADLSVLHPADCAVGDPRPYVVKGLLAEGDLGCVFGHPGSGKSLLAPMLCYMVALGLPVFGHRTRPCKTLYVAAEDFRGMQMRVRALSGRHGDAPRFALTRVGDLLSAGSPDREKLLRYAEEEYPGLIVIDTLPAAFPGLEENDAAQMGQVVAFARKLTQWGACVILVHHPAKDLGATTPRGSGILNGDLDFSLQIYPRDDTGFVRGIGRKNRNGSIEDADLAFRIDVESFGVDVDGDAITAALVGDTGMSTPRAVKLPRAPAEALKVLAGMVATAGGPVAEAAWLAECADQRVSTSDTPRNQRTAIRAAYAVLRDKRRIVVGGGMVSLPVGGSEFDPINDDATAAMRRNGTATVAAAPAGGDASNATGSLGPVADCIPAVPGSGNQKVEGMPLLQPSYLTREQRAALEGSLT